MIEAYRIGVELMLGGDLAEGIAALIPGLERVGALVTEIGKGADGAAKGLRAMGASAAGINKTAEALERMHAAMDAVNRRVAEHQEMGGSGVFVGPPGRGPGSREPERPNFTMVPPAGALTMMEDEPFNAEGRIPLYPNGRRARASSQRSGGGAHLPGAFDAVIPGLVAGETFKSIFGAAFDVQSKEAELLVGGWTPEQASAARAAAQQMQVSTPGASIDSALSILGDITAVLRTNDGRPDVAAAMGALGGLSKDAIVLGAHGHGDGLNEVFKAMQAGDLRGVISKPGTDETDPAAAQAFVHMVTLADTLTKGRVSPQQILQFTRTGGAAAAMMGNSQFFGENLALLEGMGPQAAAALQGFNRQFGAGRMSKAAEEELEIGFPQLAGHWKKAGIKQVMVDPGALFDVEALARNPLTVIHDQLLPGIDRILRSRNPNFDALSPAQKILFETQEASRFSSSQTGAKFISEAIRLFPQFEREKAGFQNQTGIDVHGLEVANNPALRVKAMTAALNALEVSLGEAAQGPAIAALNVMTGWLNDMSAWAKAHPDGAKLALEGLAGGIALFGAASVAGMAMKLMTGPAGFVALAGGIELLGGAIKGFPQWLTDAIAGAAAGAKIGGVPGAVIGGVAGPAARDIGRGASRLWGDIAHQDWNPMHKEFWLGNPNQPTYQPQSYHPDAGVPPIIQITLHSVLDGRSVAKSVTHHQLKMMGGQVSGTLRPDPSIAPQYGAHLVET